MKEEYTYMSMIRCYTLATVLLLLSSSSSWGQGVPQRWFPLDVNSYWHYLDPGDPFQNDRVVSATMDTTISGGIWTEVETLYCKFEANCRTGSRTWYQFSNDNYLLAISHPSQQIPDTLYTTHPVSVFASESPGRTDLMSRQFGQQVEVEISLEGEVNSDSTHFVLNILADGNFFLERRFVYNIGEINNLVGAIVNGVRYGDTSLIESVSLNKDVYFEDNNLLSVSLFPNPNDGRFSLIVNSNHDQEGVVSIYDPVGRLVVRRSLWLPFGNDITLYFDEMHRVSNGVYLLTLSSGGVMYTSKSIVIANQGL